MMADIGSQIDEQLAADIDAQAVAHLRELVIPQIQRECDIQEASMAAAWQTIQHSISALDRKKQIIFATLKTKESLERARKVFDDEVWNMMPPTFSKIDTAIKTQTKKDHLPSPVVSPRPDRLDDFDRRSFTLDNAPPKPHEVFSLPMGLTRIDGLPDYSASSDSAPTTPSKRKKDLEATTPGSLKKKPRQSNICQPNSTCIEHHTLIQPSIKPSLKIDTWELEGLDYLFQDPKVGKDWLCVRCNWEDALGIVRFAQHPLESGCALDHFNKKGLKCHDSSRSYTWDDILREFTFRVDEADLDENWVTANNIQTQEKAAAKTPKGKGKGKAKQPVFAPANRKAMDPSYVPEADMSLGDTQ